MKKDNTKNSEFELYDSIVNGKLRPFLPDYSSETYIKKLIEESTINHLAIKQHLSIKLKQLYYRVFQIFRTLFNCQVNIGKKIQNIDDYESVLNETTNEAHYLKDGDQIQIELKEENNRKEFLISPVEAEELNELIDIDIPPPPDLKAKYFLGVIENEFERIERAAYKILDTATEKEELSFYANKNIQAAKRIAAEAHYLSKQLKSEENDSFENSNTYIIYILKLFLKRSILYFQGLFNPFLDCPPWTEDQIRTQLYEQKPIQMVLDEFERKCAEHKRKRTEQSEVQDKKCDGPSLKNERKPSETDNQHVFSLEGDYWKVKYGRKEILLRNYKRTRYLAYLLEKPNTEFYCHELQSLVNGTIPDPDPYYSKMLDKDLKEKEGLSLIDLPIERLGEENKYKLEEHIRNLWSEMNDSKLSLAQKPESEKKWNDLKRTLSNEYGLFIFQSGKDLKFKIKTRLPKEYEKCRVNVTVQIKNAINNIDKKLPKLANHLRKYIETGSTCCYRPDSDLAIIWTIRWN
jgi:hypothetical protein